MLRESAGETQQVFSNRLRMSLASVAYFETGARKPDAASLVKLARAADDVGRPDLAAIFEAESRDALNGVVAPLRNEDEYRKVRALQAVLADPRFQHLREPLRKLLAPVEAHLRRIEKKLIEKGKK